MKHFKQLVQGLPAKKVVFAFSELQLPTNGHSLLISAVKHFAHKQSANYVIYASRSQDKKCNPLSVERKMHYINKAFPKTNFSIADSLIDAAKTLSQKYKTLVLISSADKTHEYKKLLDKHNGKEYTFTSIEVIAAGKQDPDIDAALKIKDVTKKNDIKAFKDSFSSVLTTQDIKRLINEIRVELGVDIIKERIELDRSQLREQYHAKMIFNEGQIVESAGIVYQIKKRGSNHLLLQDQSGNLVNKWIHDVTESTEHFTLLEGLTEMKFTSADKIKVARIIASTLGVDDVEKKNNAEQLINDGLRKIRSKPMRSEYVDVLHKMLETAKEADIKYDEKLVPQKVSEQLTAEEFIAELNSQTLSKIDEISKETLKSYIPKAMGSKSAADFQRGVKMAQGSGGEEELRKKSEKRSEGIHKAIKKLTQEHAELEESRGQADKHWDEAEAHLAKAKGHKEGTEQYHGHMAAHFDSKSQYHSELGQYHASDKAVEKAEEHHEKMLKAAGIHKEEVELNELDKSTLQSYSAKAGASVKDLAKKAAAHTAERHAAERKAGTRQPGELSDGPQHKLGDEESKLRNKSMHRMFMRHKADKKIWAKNNTPENREKRVAAMNAKHDRIIKSIKAVDKTASELLKMRESAELVENDTLEKQHIEQSLANKDINSKVEGTKVHVHKDNVSATRSLLKKLGYKSHSVHSGLNETNQSETTLKKKLSLSTPDVNDNESDQESVMQNEPVEKKIGHSIVSPLESDAIRKMKIAYVHESVDSSEEEQELDDLTDEDLEKIADTVKDENDILEMYDDNELSMIDEDTGEDMSDVDESSELNEVLSRAERIRAKVRFAKSKTKRERRIKIALKSRSSSSALNSRARKLAVKLMKMRLAKKPLDKLSIGEKERIERAIQRRKQVINRLAMKLVPRVRKIESERLARKANK